MNTENSALTTKLGRGLLKSVSNPSPKLLLALIVLLGLALRAYPLFLSSFPDPDFYYHLRMSHLAFEQGGIPSYDALSYGGRPYTYYPFHHLLVATVAKLTGLSVDFVLPAITLLIAALAILAAYFLARKLFDQKSALLAAFAAALHAGFIAKSTAYARPDQYSLLLIPLSLLLLLKEGKLSNLLLFALFALFPLVHLTVSAIGLFIFLACALAVKASWKKIGVACAGFLLGASYYAGWDLKQMIASKAFASSAELVSFDLSFIFFYSGVLLIFGAIAALEFYNALKGQNFIERQKNSFKLVLVWLAVALALQLAANRGVVFLAPALCVAAGFGFKHALEKSGKYEKYMLALALAAIAIGTGAFLSVQHPGFTTGDVSVAQWLGQNSHAGLVAAPWDRGHLLTFYGSKVLADGYFEYAPAPERKVAAIDEMLAASSGERALQLAVENGVEFIFLDEKTLSQLPANSVWTRNVSGFEKVFENKAQAWKLSEKA